MKKYILWLAFVATTIAFAAAGDRFIKNPNTDGDLSLCVAPGGTEDCPVSVDGATSDVTVDSNVGVGVTPAYPLHVENSGTVRAYVKSTDGAGVIDLDSFTGSDAVYSVRENGTTEFTFGHDASASVFNISPGSTLGDGLTMSAAGDVTIPNSLNVNELINIVSTNNTVAPFSIDNTNGTSTANLAEIKDEGSNVLLVQADGDLEASVTTDGDCGVGSICSGIWTPTLVFTTNSGTQNVSTTGTWSKLGRQIFAEFNVNITTISGHSGDLRVQGFDSEMATGVTGGNWSCRSNGIDYATGNTYLTGRTLATDEFQLLEGGDNIDVTTVQESQVSDGDDLNCSGIYPTGY